MSSPLENWQAIRLNKPMTVTVPYFPEAGIVAKEDEKIAVKIPEGSTVLISIKGPKATFKPILPVSQQPAPQTTTPQPAPTNQKTKGTYQPKATGNNSNPANAASATTNTNASAANGGVANGHEGQPQRHPKNNKRNHQNHHAAAVPNGTKVVTAEELKRQREEQALHEAWLLRRKSLMQKEREEQDRRYQERVARQLKAKEEAEAKRKKELEEAKAKKKKELEAAGVKLTEEDLSAAVGEKGAEGPSKKTCWVCDSEEHISRKCPLRCKRSECNAVRDGGHAAKDCKISCFLCHTKGHDESYCTKHCTMCKRGKCDPHLTENCPIICGLCGGKGHRTRECSYDYRNRAN